MYEQEMYEQDKKKYGYGNVKRQRQGKSTTDIFVLISGSVLLGICAGYMLTEQSYISGIPVTYVTIIANYLCGFIIGFVTMITCISLFS